MTDLLQAEHLSRYFGPHCAVNDVSFTLAKGEVLGFLGPNGAGKTTTLQMLCGTLAPSAGRVSINGADMLRQPLAAKKLLGFLPDQPPLYPDMTVADYLSYCARLHRVPGRQVAAAVRKALKRCELETVAQRLLGNLSKGYQQRAGIAQALVHEPEWVLLDEPTSGLDPLQIRAIRALIRELGSERGVILSTHILSEVQQCCNRVQIMQQGSLVLNVSADGLRQLLNGEALLISTQRPLAIERLAGIAGVSSVESLAPTQCRVHYLSGSNPASQLTAIINAADWGLLELTPERKTLEDLFVTLLREDREGC